MALQPGTNLGQYRIVEQLGRGGMATVYKAYQPGLDRHVAIKVLPPFYAEDPEYLGRFRQEAISIARMRHPNIMAVYDYGEQEGVTYIVGEYVPGGTLARYMGEPASLDLAITLMKPVAAALDYAHSRKPAIIHRDIKPSNILLTDEGLPVVSDFGIAKMVGGGMKTQTGVAVGTPEYMSPEQALGNATAASDIYSLGIVLYQLLTGQVPYTADTPMAILLAHINSPRPMLRALRPDLPEAVESVLLKAMAKEPGERFETAGSMVQALERAIAPGAGAQPSVELPTVARGLETPRPIDPDPPVQPTTIASRPGLEAPIAPPESEVEAAGAPPRLSPAGPAHGASIAVPAPAPLEAKHGARPSPAPLQRRDGGRTRSFAMVAVPLALLAAAALWALSASTRQDGQPVAASAVTAQPPTSMAVVPPPTAALPVSSTPAGTDPTPSSGPLPTVTAMAVSVPVAGSSTTPTPSPVATAVPSPESTATATPVVPTATVAAPTATPPPPPTPVPTEKPTATPIPAPSAPGLVTDFESFGSWQSGDQANGSFSPSGGQVHSGGTSGQLSYNLPNNESDFVVFLHQPPIPMSGQPTTLRIWVYEDGSGHFLNALIRDSQGERWQVSFGRITGQGWRQRETIIGANQPWPSGHWDGPSNGVVDYPVAFAGLVLDRVDGPLSGSVYVDDISY